MAAPTGKPFHPLTGLELRKLIVKAVDDAIAKDTRFKQHLCYPQVAFSVGLRVVTYPADGGSISKGLQGVIGEAPEGEVDLVPPAPEVDDPGAFTAGHLVTGHRATPSIGRPEAVTQATAPPVRTREVALAGGVSRRSDLVTSEPPMPERPLEVERDGKNTLRELPSAGGGRMEAGVRPMPPGLAAAIEVQQAPDRALAEQVRRNNEKLLGGTRVIVNPNEARRAAGMPVPAAQRGAQVAPGVRGMVDMPPGRPADPGGDNSF